MLAGSAHKSGVFSDSGAALVQHVGVGQRSFRMIETNGITLRVVVEGQGPLPEASVHFHRSGNSLGGSRTVMADIQELSATAFARA